MKSLGLILAVLPAMAIAAWIDWNASEVQVVVIVAFGLAFTLGILQPKGAWRWALLIAAAIVGIELASVVLNVLPPSIARSMAENPGRVHLHTYANALASAFSLLPALVGAYAGAFIRRLFNAPQSISTGA